MSLEDLKVELLRAEFPSLRPDHDPDIERYFDMRAAGRPGAALALYEARIKPRYPEEAHRSAAMRAYRLRDPSYPRLISKAYGTLGDRLLERTKRVIKYIAMYAASYDRTDAYATIKAAENILRMLPRDRFAAVSVIERLRRYAEMLDYQSRPMAVAEELIRAYVNEQLDVVQEERARRKAETDQEDTARRSALAERDKEDTRKSVADARKREAEREKRKKTAPPAARPVAAFDLSSLRFSAADLARIQIPPAFDRIEDKTLAFCFKYWTLTEDSAFERVLFLYSRKYSVKHYEVFSVIRDGRRRGHRDEEILAAVLGMLSSGYYYSIRGDAYLQRNWTGLKKRLEPIIEETKKRRPRRKRAEMRPVKPAAIPATTVAASSAAAAAAPAARPAMLEKPTVRFEAETRVPRGSVSDRLRKLSGKSYDVFKDRFFAHGRPAIRTVLSGAKVGKKALFESVPQQAENLVYEFLRDHYADPYMDWEASREREALSAIGYELAVIDPVIEECYRRIG